MSKQLYQTNLCNKIWINIKIILFTIKVKIQRNHSISLINLTTFQINQNVIQLQINKLQINNKRIHLRI